MEKSDSSGEGGSVRGWLNSLVKILQAHMPRPADKDGADVDLPFAQAGARLAEPAPISQDEMARFSERFSKLPAEERDLLVLVVVEGCTYCEVARRLDVRVEDVTAQLARTRKKLCEPAERHAA